MVSFLDGQKTAILAINAPSQVNLGIVKNELEKASKTPGRALRGVDIRRVEYELRERGISVAGTPALREHCPAWMRVGFVLYEELSKIGFKPFGQADTKRQFLETHPYACFCVLAEGVPFPKPTLEGRLQRQLILNENNMHIPDAMDFFEEITRFRLIKGILPTDVLYSPEKLDVLVAAYTAWLAANRPGEITIIGDKTEGQMILPVRELKEKY